MKQLIKKIIGWLANTRILAFPRRIFARVILYGISVNDHRSKVIDLIGQIKKESKMLLADHEAYQIFMAVKRTEKIKGDIAEVGVYQGGSAKLICEAKGDRALYLFDTFEGLPEVGVNDELFHKGQYSFSVERVKNYLEKYSDVYIYKGLFLETAKPVRNKTFSFVHVDVDLYESTLNCLKFFYPRMTKGGIIISHDYMDVMGVRKAFDEFFKDKPEPIIEMFGSQCLIVKI